MSEANTDHGGKHGDDQPEGGRTGREGQEAVTDPNEDSEVDYLDDERDDDQLPLDEVETREIGVNLDDPEDVAREE